VFVSAQHTLSEAVARGFAAVAPAFSLGLASAHEKKSHLSPLREEHVKNPRPACMMGQVRSNATIHLQVKSTCLCLVHPFAQRETWRARAYMIAQSLCLLPRPRRQIKSDEMLRRDSVPILELDGRLSQASWKLEAKSNRRKLSSSVMASVKIALMIQLLTAGLVYKRITMVRQQEGERTCTPQRRQNSLECSLAAKAGRKQRC
jgi:hypothetical protein